jgi:regulator of sirC expression with transglutaminase-like and TPR domain
MTRPIIPVLIAAVAGWGGVFAEEVAEETAETIERLIAELDAESYAVREDASRQLVEIGDSAIPAVEAAQKHDSAEVRYRATAILARLKVGPVLKIRRQLAEFALGSKEELDVEQGMFLLSLILDEKVKKADLSRQLDEIAAKVRERLGKDVNPAKAEPAKAVEALRQVLFTDLGFGPNPEDYENPNNCSLAKMLQTKKGRPVFVSHLMIAVARRLEIPLVGLPVTGFYIVKYDGSRAPAGFPKEDIYIHPYEKGRILSREDRQREYPHYDPDVMVPAGTSRETMERMLNNLESTLAPREEPNDSLRRDLVRELATLLQQTGSESPAEEVRIFGGGREIPRAPPRRIFDR